MSTSTFRRGRLWLVLICGMLFAAALTACNTTKGVGEDIEEAGEGIQDAAD